jgi:hypothetical protein
MMSGMRGAGRFRGAVVKAQLGARRRAYVVVGAQQQRGKRARCQLQLARVRFARRASSAGGAQHAELVRRRLVIGCRARVTQHTRCRAHRAKDRNQRPRLQRSAPRRRPPGGLRAAKGRLLDRSDDAVGPCGVGRERAECFTRRALFVARELSELPEQCVVRARLHRMRLSRWMATTCASGASFETSASSFCRPSRAAWSGACATDRPPARSCPCQRRSDRPTHDPDTSARTSRVRDLSAWPRGIRGDA